MFYRPPPNDEKTTKTCGDVDKKKHGHSLMVEPSSFLLAATAKEQRELDHLLDQAS
jgi:hypothetical protein